MPIAQQLDSDLKDAMRARDQVRLDVIRQVKATVMNAEIKEGNALSDTGIQEILTRLVRQHRESIEMFAKGGRPELVQKEEAELKVLQSYLPQQMSQADVVALAKKIAAEVGARGPADKGKVMGKLMPQVKGKAEGMAVNDAVTQVLASLGP
ncbi:MAG: GatB/YqeY domain-containing protein [Dehalococcoidia bacterium]|nr:GatB/YqeY domain-containing protein [Dehalococcoidia bacterium]